MKLNITRQGNRVLDTQGEKIECASCQGTNKKKTPPNYTNKWYYYNGRIYCSSCVLNHTEDLVHFNYGQGDPLVPVDQVNT